MPQHDPDYPDYWSPAEHFAAWLIEWITAIGFVAAAFYYAWRLIRWLTGGA